jgi:hypothetical protein
MKISCDNCKYNFNGTCDSLNLLRECLKYSDTGYKHQKYPDYDVYWYEYNLWEPRIEMSVLLTDEDFEI